MSWFGFGGSGKKDDSSSSSSDYSYDNNSSSFQETDSSSFAAPSAPMSSLGGSGSFEQEIAMEQQKALIQAVVMKITDMAFDQCVTKPSGSLSSSEQSCIAATVGKYLDTTELIVGRFTGSQQH